MIRKEIINYSLRNLEHRKSRSLLTILSIFVGVTSIFVFVSFGLGLYGYVNSFATSTSADKLSIMPKGMGAPGMDDAFSITDKDVSAIEKTTGVYEATGIYSKAAEIKQGKINKFIFLIGYDPSKPLIMELSGIKLYSGRNLKPNDDAKAVLGYNYILDDKIFPNKYELGDKIELQGHKVTIVGFLESAGNPQDDSQVYITSDYFKKIYPNVTGYGFVIARVDIKNIDEIIKRVEKSLRHSRGLEEGKEDFFVQSFQDLLNQYMGALDIIIGFVILIALVSVVVSAVNTANTTITSILERTKEIGIMKAVGARNHEIFTIFVFESGFLGFVAGIVGVLVGWIIAFSAGLILKSLGWSFLSPSYPPVLFIGAILFATLTGALSGAWPAYRASRIRPVAALRYE